MSESESISSHIAISQYHNNGFMLKKKRIIVTGASGFVGSQLTRKLLKMGNHLHILVRPSSDLWRIKDIVDRIEIIKRDLIQIDSTELVPVLKDADIIFHLAAAGVNQSCKDPHSMIETNIFGTFRMLQLAREIETERFVFAGSCFEYGSGTYLSENDLPNPCSEYGASKSGAWMLVNAFAQRYQLPVVSLRPFTVYGPFESAYRLIPHAILSAINENDIMLTEGAQTRDFVFIDDMIDALVKAATVTKAINGTYNICCGSEVSVKNLVKRIIKLTGSKSRPLFGSKPYRDNELWNLSGNPKEAERELGWTAKTSLDIGLQRAIHWFRENKAVYPAYKMVSHQS